MLLEILLRCPFSDMTTQIADFDALTSRPVSERFRGVDSDCGLRRFLLKERLQTEDRLFQCGRELRLSEGSTGVVVSQPMIAAVK